MNDQVELDGVDNTIDDNGHVNYTDKDEDKVEEGIKVYTNDVLKQNCFGFVSKSIKNALFPN